MNLSEAFPWLKNRYVESCLRLFFPAYCGACRNFLELEEEILCRDCRIRLANLRRAPDSALLEMPMRHVDEAWALYPYESPLKELLVGLKFRRRVWLARAFEDDMKGLAEAVLTENRYDALIPIPMDFLRLARREFNQARLLADRLSKASEIPLRTDLLAKRHRPQTQIRLGRSERLRNPVGAFRVRAGDGIRGKSFLLVDDIITTGATAEEAARCLKEEGAKRVGLFAVAQTLRFS